MNPCSSRPVADTFADPCAAFVTGHDPGPGDELASQEIERLRRAVLPPAPLPIPGPLALQGTRVIVRKTLRANHHRDPPWTASLQAGSVTAARQARGLPWTSAAREKSPTRSATGRRWALDPDNLIAHRCRPS